MNKKIFNLTVKKIQEYLNLDRHPEICNNLSVDTIVDDLLWTPARYRKFKEDVEKELGITISVEGTIKEIVSRLDKQYLNKFFSQVWTPNTELYTYTGWQLADEVNALSPNKVLDVGCGYNRFKQKIQNLIGIDPYNDQSDYQIDIIDFVDEPDSFDVIIALGSINFNELEDIDKQLEVCVKLLKPSGKMYVRVNPGIEHKHGQWIDIFPWTFSDVQHFAKKYKLSIDTFKKENNNRLYFVYTKLGQS